MIPHGRFIQDALEESCRAMTYLVSQKLATMFPDRAIVEGDDYDFNLYQYVREGFCTIRFKEGVHSQLFTAWHVENGVYDKPQNLWAEVEWRGEALDVVQIGVPEESINYFWIIADRDRVARGFFEAVCSFNPDSTGEVLAFGNGRFESSTTLYRGATDSTFDDLILPDRLKDELKGDLSRFFRSHATYETIGAPWKRGLLLTGPPGNGKTHTIKALIVHLGKPCIYVKSFKSERWTEETAIARIFNRARQVAPCLLVMEDLDALVTKDNRSFLLNELDGFARNTGIAVVATTNHPEKLDPALAERPSRFDRKFTFPNPALPERLAFLRRWQGRLPDLARPTDSAIELAAEQTDGFSFAYLKELFIGTILARASLGPESDMDDVLIERVGELQGQIGDADKGGRPSKRQPRSVKA